VGATGLNHVGVIVDDLEAATAFFVDLGLERSGTSSVEGEWVGRVIGLDDVRSELVWLEPADGSSALELVKFHRPADEEGPVPAPANRLGIRHLAFIVDDLDATLEGVREKGLDTIGEVENYQDTFRICYVRGPEGLIVELAERIGSDETA